MWSMLIVLMTSVNPNPPITSTVITGFATFEDCRKTADSLYTKYDYLAIREFTCIHVRNK